MSRRRRRCAYCLTWAAGFSSISISRRLLQYLPLLPLALQSKTPPLIVPPPDALSPFLRHTTFFLVLAFFSSLARSTNLSASFLFIAHSPFSPMDHPWRRFSPFDFSRLPGYVEFGASIATSSLGEPRNPAMFSLVCWMLVRFSSSFSGPSDRRQPFLFAS